jgi:nucleotide-binding universal stress UspA family protein
MYRSIVVGYVESPQGEDALALGTDLAAATDARLTIASVVPAVAFATLGPQEANSMLVSDPMRAAMAAALERAAARVSGNSGASGAAERLAGPQRLGVETRIVASESDAGGLHEIAEEEGADLLVVGSCHRGSVGRVLLGSVGQRLLHGAPCAIAVAPRGYAAGESTTFRRLAVAFNGSPESQLALDAAVALARTLGSSLRVVMVLEAVGAEVGRWLPLPGIEPQAMLEHGEMLQRRQEQAEHVIQGVASDLRGQLQVEPILRVGPAERMLVAEAEREIDLMFLGSRGYGAVRRAIAGSVSSAAMHDAPCPVIVVPRGSADHRAAARLPAARPNDA